MGYVRRWEESAFDARHPGLLYTCHPKTPAKESGEDCRVWTRQEGVRHQGPREGLSLPLGRRHADTGPQRGTLKAAGDSVDNFMEKLLYRQLSLYMQLLPGTHH